MNICFDKLIKRGVGVGGKGLQKMAIFYYEVTCHPQALVDIYPRLQVNKEKNNNK